MKNVIKRLLLSIVLAPAYGQKFSSFLFQLSINSLEISYISCIKHMHVQNN